MEEEIETAYLLYLVSKLPNTKLSEFPESMSLRSRILISGGALVLNGIKIIYYSEFRDLYLKRKEMEKDKPTIKDEVTWLRQALSIQGIEIHEKIIEVMIESYKVVKEKGNKTTFKDALDVTKEINRRNKTTIKYDIK